jgi:hypothetical protein
MPNRWNGLRRIVEKIMARFAYPNKQQDEGSPNGRVFLS